VDEILIFNSLSEEMMKQITDIQLERLKERAAQKGLILQFTEAARDLLATEGYDPVFGARPLKRTIQRQVENPLATSILEGKFTEGSSILVDASGGRITFTLQPAPEKAGSTASEDA